MIFYDKAILSTLRGFMKNLVIVFTMMFSVSAFSQSAMSGMTGKAMEMGKAKAGEAMVACKNDTAHFCKEMKTLDTQKACLKENYSKLSDGCKKVITPM
jgi:hypothetical protein